MEKRTLYLFILFLVTLNSCALFGIRYKVQNPKKPGKYPNFSKETILLGELNSLRECYDVTYYYLDVCIDAEKKSIGGWVQISARATKDIDSIQIDLDYTLKINSIAFANRKGEKLNYNRKERAVYIKLPKKIPADSSFNVHVNYQGKPRVAKKPPWAGGLVWKKDKLNRYWAGIACQSEGASTWFPCKDHTSDEPDSVLLQYSTPQRNLTIVGNGQSIKNEVINDTAYFLWKVSYPINTYNITFYLGNFQKIQDTYTGISGKKLLLSYYVLEYNYEIAISHFKQVKKHLKVYEELFGEYPWYNDGFKLIESPYAGMEHQTAIAYGNGYKNDLYGYDDYIILHETGHEWFGNAITASDLCDVWLQEGFTTYAEALYLEKAYGTDYALRHLIIYRWTIKNKRPLVGPAGRRYFDYNDGDVYVKGAWVLHSLRTTINDDKQFFSILKSFYKEHKLKTSTSKDFIETTNRITQKNYNWFFNQYLYKREVPFLEYYLANDGYLYYRWIYTDDSFDKLPVRINYADNNYVIFPTTNIDRINSFNNNKIIGTLNIDNNYALFGINKNKNLQKMFFK